jgi:hypothetical protein
MQREEHFLVYPDGETLELESPLPFDALVDLNGRPLPLPLSTHRQIAYRVTKIRREDGRGFERSYHYLELVPAAELIAYL